MGQLARPAVAKMTEAHGYRAFVIGLNGHVIGRTDIFAESDDNANEQARQLVGAHAIELWDGVRMIARFEPEGGPT
jgi:hypothetical protein